VLAPDGVPRITFPQEDNAMLEVLQFIFSSFWIWLGTVVLAAVIFGSLGSTLGAVCGRRNR
jgi:hypothetical protein